MKTRQPLMAIPTLNGEQEPEVRYVGGGSAREETDGAVSSNHTPEVDCEQYRDGKQELISKKNNILQLENRRANGDLEVNQDVSDKRVRIPEVKPPVRHRIGHINGHVSDMTTYDAPLHQGHRIAHDYYKRQEQQKIWQENQALIKRLQSTKATLNFKQWEKDGKWAQEFLKTQEKRRSALQHELRRAQASPHAVLRSRPLKSLHAHQLKNIHHEGSDKNLTLACYPTKADVVTALSSRMSSRCGSKGLGKAGSSDATVTQKSAANHRRIMELRKQNSSSHSTNDAAESFSTDINADNGLDPATGDESAAFIPDNDIVTVRFTFSRGRSRGQSTSSNCIEGEPTPLDVDASDRDMRSLSGAFSPGVELEYALNAFTVSDPAITQSQRDQTPKVIVSTVDEAPEDNANQNYQVDRGTEARNVPPQTEHMQSGEEEEYDDDNFDDEPLGSSQTSLEQHDKHETNGDFKEVSTTQDNFTTTTFANNQKEEDEDEEEYSHDGFE
ncbi:hypothetical protein PHPALM_30550 [Phytophthora palmivora]|uniref:Uncharacterized protein n=1 Tax=Phytophthora palmivora TaxID=4796 RepID=A0A2P4X4V9_9STRA|nr:hypothetical protein PHPALM_30550 [Phytophthora palmivora]